MYIQVTKATVKYLAPQHMLYPEVDAELFLCGKIQEYPC